MLSRTIVIQGEDPARFAALLNTLREELTPRTPIEESLVEDLATCRWRQRRLLCMETACFTQEIRLQDPEAATGTSAGRATTAFTTIQSRLGRTNRSGGSADGYSCIPNPIPESLAFPEKLQTSWASHKQRKYSGPLILNTFTQMLRFAHSHFQQLACYILSVIPASATNRSADRSLKTEY